MSGHAALANKKITAPDEIHTVLEHICKTQQMLTLQFPNIETKFKSLVSQVDLERHFILFGELMPPTGHDLILKAEEFKAFTNYFGVPVVFKSKFITCGKDDRTGLSFYQVALPTRLIYLQRRETTRLPVQNLGLTARLITANQTRMVVRLIDLSILGFRAWIERSHFLPKENDTLICELDFGDGRVLTTPVLVRWRILETKTQQHIELGLKFLDVTPDLQRRIIQFINERRFQ